MHSTTHLRTCNQYEYLHRLIALSGKGRLAAGRAAYLFGSSSENMEGRMERQRLKYLMCFSLKMFCGCSIPDMQCTCSCCCKAELYMEHMQTRLTPVHTHAGRVRAHTFYVRSFAMRHQREDYGIHAGSRGRTSPPR